jgi:cytochrome c
MRLGPIVTAAVLAAALAGCSKSGTNKQAEGSQATSSEQSAAANETVPVMSAEEQAKALAALPAPYNTADLANGEAKFALCKSCHTVTAGGASMTGPNLHGVIGRKAGQVEAFKFSDALHAANITWTPDKLDPWLEKPADMVPGTKMTFPGLKEPKDRTDVIAWLMVNAK